MARIITAARRPHAPVEKPAAQRRKPCRKTGYVAVRSTLSVIARLPAVQVSRTAPAVFVVRPAGRLFAVRRGRQKVCRRACRRVEGLRRATGIAISAFATPAGLGRLGVFGCRRCGAVGGS